jgi:hypothetical protein
MHITLTPMRGPQPMTLHRVGDILTINGEAYDFAAIPDGATLPQGAVDCPWLASDVERIGGVLHLALILPHGAGAPAQTRFPAPLTLSGDGPVALPPFDEPAQEEPLA